MFIYQQPVISPYFCKIHPLIQIPNFHIASIFRLSKGYENETIHQFYRSLSALVDFQSLPDYFENITATLAAEGYDSPRIMFEVRNL